MNFCCILPVEHLIQVSSKNQLMYWDATSFGTIFLWWKCPDEIAVHSYCSLP